MCNLFGIENIWMENLLICESPFTDIHRKVSSAGQLQDRKVGHFSLHTCLQLNSQWWKENTCPTEAEPGPHPAGWGSRWPSRTLPAGAHLRQMCCLSAVKPGRTGCPQSSSWQFLRKSEWTSCPWTAPGSDPEKETSWTPNKLRTAYK